MTDDIILIKLGGSVVTFKNKPLSSNEDAIKKIAKKLSKLDKKFIIIHGGGSFGHFWSTKFDMHTKPDNYNVNGISVVHSSMLHLNKVIIDILHKFNLNPYGISPSVLLSNNKPISKKINELINMAIYGLTPVTYGDIVYVNNNKYSIMSGDVLMSILCKEINPLKVIFAVNVDGIYESLENRQIIKEILVNKINQKMNLNLKIPYDVTGGIKRKVVEATNIARNGKNVYIVNGFKPEEIENIINEKEFIGTIFKGIK
ncbi:MAG: isopentenyl phosphate kinase [Nitrososphaeraceae archaeon]